MITWISDKNKRALDLLQGDSSTKLSSKIKRLETLDAELAANQNSLNSIYEVNKISHLLFPFLTIYF